MIIIVAYGLFKLTRFFDQRKLGSLFGALIMKNPTFYRRKDLQTAFLIDYALLVLRKSGLPQAHACLVANGVPGRIVKRLLSMPGARRRTDVIPISHDLRPRF